MKRRQFVSLGVVAGAGMFSGCGKKVVAAEWSWKGVVFQSPASFTLLGMEGEAAERLTMECVAEMKRLEALFSLQNPESALSRLNRDGTLREVPEDFQMLVELALAMAERSDGVFDPTIQPYWKFLHEGGAGEAEEVMKLVDYRNVMVSGTRIAFAKDGMAMTLNGMAQGFVTDRIAAMVKGAGVANALINIGEYVAIGRHSAERPWMLGIRGGGAEGEVVEEMALEDEALAVSSGGGYRFGAGNHLVHPEGAYAPEGRVVAVVAPLAVIADGLSTTCGLMRTETARELVEGVEGARLRVWERDGAGEWWEV